jgi:hypothetical protein
MALQAGSCILGLRFVIVFERARPTAAHIASTGKGRALQSDTILRNG